VNNADTYGIKKHGLVKRCPDCTIYISVLSFAASLLLFVKDSPLVRLKPVCQSVPFCHPFTITRHISLLFTFSQYSCTDRCSTAVCSDWRGYVRRWGNRWQRCAVVGVQQGVGAAEGSKRTAVAVCL
jgi:hypothetical protein